MSMYRIGLGTKITPRDDDEICNRCHRVFRVFDTNPEKKCPYCKHVNDPEKQKVGAK